MYMLFLNLSCPLTSGIPPPRDLCRCYEATHVEQQNIEHWREKLHLPGRLLSKRWLEHGTIEEDMQDKSWFVVSLAKT